MPSLHNHDDWTVVKRRFPSLHSKASRTIQPQRLVKNDSFPFPPTHTRYGTSSVAFRSKTTQPYGQCRDQKEYWWWQISTSSFACLLSIPLRDRCLIHVGRSIYFCPIGDRGRGELPQPPETSTYGSGRAGPTTSRTKERLEGYWNGLLYRST